MKIIDFALFLLGAFCLISSIINVFNRKNIDSDKRTVVIIMPFLLSVVFFTVAFIFYVPDIKAQPVDNKHNPVEQANIAPQENKISMAKKLAILDAGYDVPDTSLQLIRIGVLLNKLSDEYQEPVDSIAEWTSKAKGVVHDQGLEESCLGILELMHRVGRSGNMTYKQAILVYVLVKTK